MAMTSWTIHTALVTTAMVLALLALGRRWPTRPADRHLLWVLVFARFLMPPVLTLSILPTIGLFNSQANITEKSVSVETTPTPEDDPLAWFDPSDLAEAALAPIVAMGEPLDLEPEPAPEPPAPIAVPRAMPSVEITTTAPTFHLESAIPHAWIAGSLAFLCWQGWAVWRFRRRLRPCDDENATADELAAEVARLARRMNVRVPRLRVVAGLGTPALWCPWPGVVELLIPDHLLKSQSPEAWRAVLAHELGHRRRLDHWTGWLVLAAGLVWWWHPAYWVARKRLEAEAELACDAWAVWAEPTARRALAGILFELACVSRPVPAPVVGATGAGRFFERRLTMILKRNVPARLSAGGLMAAVAAALLVIPTWAPARDDDKKPKKDGDRPAAADVETTADRAAKIKDGDKIGLEPSEADKKKARVDQARQEIQELEKRVDTARKEMIERMQKAQNELQEQMQASQKAVQEAMSKLVQARLRLAEAEGRPLTPQEQFQIFGIERAGLPSMMMPPGGMMGMGGGGMMMGRGNMATPRGPNAPGRPGRPPTPPTLPDAPNATDPFQIEVREFPVGGPGPEVERRLERLENQLEELMKELRQRPARESREPADAEGPDAGDRPTRERPAPARAPVRERPRQDR